MNTTADQLATLVPDASAGSSAYSAMALAAVSLGGDLSFIGDPMVVTATEIQRDISTPAEGSDTAARVAHIQSMLAGLEAALTDAPAKAAGAIEGLLAAVQNSDLEAAITAAQTLGRTALILAYLEGGGSMETTSDEQGLVSQSDVDRKTLLETRALQLREMVDQQIWGQTMRLARMVEVQAMALASSTIQDATRLVTGGHQALEALQNGDGELAAKLAGALTRQATVFAKPLWLKQGQLKDLVDRVGKGLEHKAFGDVRSLALALARTASLFADSTVRQGLWFATEAPRIETSAKGQDLTALRAALTEASRHT